MGQILDHDEVELLLRDFATLPVRSKQINLAFWLFELVDLLLGAKAGTDIIFVRRFDPELGDISEEVTYSYLRKHLLKSLHRSKRPDLHDLAIALLPDRLLKVTKGWVHWDRDTVEDLRSKLEVACTEAGLDRYRDIPVWYFSHVGKKVLMITAETRQGQAARLRALRVLWSLSSLSNAGGTDDSGIDKALASVFSTALAAGQNQEGPTSTAVAVLDQPPADSDVARDLGQTRPERRRKSTTWTHRRVMTMRDQYKQQHGPEVLTRERFVEWMQNEPRFNGDVPSLSTVRNLSQELNGWLAWWDAEVPERPRHSG